MTKQPTVQPSEVELGPLHIDVLCEGHLVYDWPSVVLIDETQQSADRP